MASSRRAKRKRRPKKGEPGYRKSASQGVPNGGPTELESGAMTGSFQTEARLCKVDRARKMLWGWAMVSTEDGIPYVDVQTHHIPEDRMFQKSRDFMLNSRRAFEQHLRSDAGTVVFAMPVTNDLLKATGMTSPITGLLVGVEADDAALDRAENGDLTGFSVGGSIKNEIPV